MSEGEGQETFSGHGAPTLPPIRLLFGEELALPAHPPAESTPPDLRNNLQPIPPQPLREDVGGRAPRPPTFRHSSGLEMQSRAGFSTSGLPSPAAYSIDPHSEPSTHESRRRYRIPDSVHRTRSWSDTVLPRIPGLGTTTTEGSAYNHPAESSHISSRNMPHGHHQPLNPYPPEYPPRGDPFLPPTSTTSSRSEVQGAFIPRYECPYCRKSFARPSSLKIHINSHTGERPFVCPVERCGKTFSVLSNMRRHARTAHRFEDPTTMGEGPSTQSHEDFPAGHQSEPSAGTHGHEGTDDDDDSSVMHEEDEQPMQE